MESVLKSCDEPVVRPLTEQDNAAWEQFVNGHENAVFYHTLAWRDFVLVCEQNGRITGILPMFLVRFPLLGSKLISQPYDIGAGGPLVSEPTAAIHLADRDMQLARELRAG